MQEGFPKEMTLELGVNEQTDDGQAARLLGWHPSQDYDVREVHMELR